MAWAVPTGLGAACELMFELGCEQLGWIDEGIWRVERPVCEVPRVGCAWVVSVIVKQVSEPACLEGE